VAGILLALAASAFVVDAALFANAWLQRSWLSSKWLYRAPYGLLAFAAFAAVAGLALYSLVRTWRSGRWASASARPLLWIVPFVMVAWACVWTIDPPTLVYDAEVAIAGAAAAWSMLVAWRVRRSDDPRARWGRTAELLLVELSVCVLLAEVGMRTLRSVTRIPILATSSTDVDAWILEHRLPPGSFHFGFPVNSNGMVDVEPSVAAQRRRRVVCLGDSFSVGVVPHHLHYTTVTERSFDDLEVYNLGVVNSGPREYRRLLELQGLQLKPDLIVVALFLGNDVLDAKREARTPITTWMDRDEILVLQAPRRLWAVVRERIGGTNLGDGKAIAESFGLPTNCPTSPDEIERRLPWLADPIREPPTLSVERFAYVEWTRAEITLPEKMGDYRDALDELARLRETAGSVPIACLLIPDEFQVEDTVWLDVEGAGLAPNADRDLPQKVVGSWLEEHGIPYVDLLPRLRAVPPLADGLRHVYHLRDTHWNARGNGLAGEALAELIERCEVDRRTRGSGDAPPK
jgi:hypothetical protein